MPPEGQPSGGVFALYSALPHFFDVVNVIQRRERFDDLAVGLILFSSALHMVNVTVNTLSPEPAYA